MKANFFFLKKNNTSSVKRHWPRYKIYDTNWNGPARVGNRRSWKQYQFFGITTVTELHNKNQMIGLIMWENLLAPIFRLVQYMTQSTFVIFYYFDWRARWIFISAREISIKKEKKIAKRMLLLLTDSWRRIKFFFFVIILKISWLENQYHPGIFIDSKLKIWRKFVFRLKWPLVNVWE